MKKPAKAVAVTLVSILVCGGVAALIRETKEHTKKLKVRR